MNCPKYPFYRFVIGDIYEYSIRGNWPDEYEQGRILEVYAVNKSNITFLDKRTGRYYYGYLSIGGYNTPDGGHIQREKAHLGEPEFEILATHLED